METNWLEDIHFYLNYTKELIFRLLFSVLLLCLRYQHPLTNSVNDKVKKLTGM